MSHEPPTTMLVLQAVRGRGALSTMIIYDGLRKFKQERNKLTRIAPASDRKADKKEKAGGLYF